MCDGVRCISCAQASHSCSFWSDRLQNWSSEGCEFLESSDTFTLCRCTHLTSFISLITPPLTLPIYSINEAFTWENLCKYPTGIIIVGALHVIVGVLCYFGHTCSLKRNRVGITWTYRFLNSERDPNEIDDFDEIVIAQESEVNTMLAAFCKKIKLEHTLVSIFKNHPCEPMTTVDRILLSYAAMTSGAAVGTDVILWRFVCSL
jgi:hypothetical protein